MKKQVMILPWISLSFLLYGMLWAFCSEFSYKKEWKPAIWLVILIAGAVTFMVLQLKRGAAITATLTALAGCGIFLMRNLSHFTNDLQTILYYINQKALKYNNIVVSEFGLEEKGKTDGSFLLLLIGFCVLVYIAIVAFLLHSRFWGLVICLGSFLGMAFGKTPDVKAVMCVFFGALLAAGWISYQENIDGKKDFRRKKNAESKGAFAACILLAVILIVSITSGNYIGQKTKSKILSHSEKVLSRQHEMERIATRKVQEAAQFFRGCFALDSEGRLSNTEPYYTGKTVMEVTLRSKPTEDVYLRGFVGGNYQNGKWSETDGQAFFANFEDVDSQEMIKSISYESFLQLKDYMGLTYEYLADADYDDVSVATDSNAVICGAESLQLVRQQVEVKYTGFGKLSKYAYMPYFSDVKEVIGSSGERCLEMNADNGINKLENSFRVSSFLLNMSQIQRFCVEMQTAAEAEWYMTYISSWHLDRYIKYAQSEYLQIPERGLEEFEKFANSYNVTRCKTTDEQPDHKKGKKRILQAVDDVKSILGSTAVYSKELGDISMGDDYVEHFLLKEKAGYCEHFATAGTLLLREYGVPARYVSGYRVPVSAFEKNEDGSYTAQVLDLDAHAWTEFLYCTLGWIPVEMTPASRDNTKQYNPPATVKPTQIPSDNNANVSNNEESSKKEEKAKDNKQTKAPVTAKPNSDVGNDDMGVQKTASGNGTDFVKIFNVNLGILLFVIAIVVIIFVLRARFKRRQEEEALILLQDKNSLYLLERMSQLYRFMRYCRVCKVEKLSDEEWIFLVSEYCNTSEWKEESESICKILQKAAFSQKAISTEEREAVCLFAASVEQNLYRKQNKLKQCYLRVLGWKKGIE